MKQHVPSDAEKFVKAVYPDAKLDISVETIEDDSEDDDGCGPCYEWSIVTPSRRFPAATFPSKAWAAAETTLIKEGYKTNYANL